MSESPIALRRCEPERIAPDTHLVRQLLGEGTGPVAVYVNSMVITGAEPVIVDFGPTVNGEAWLEDVFSIVEPDDVRWLFLSHDDPDHTGNLREVMARCSNATLVTNWFSVERMSTEYPLPMDRMRWVNDGESFDAGDRRFTAVIPPTFDGPTTRGLLDERTGVYWAADAFATPVTHEVTDISELDPGFWREGFVQFQRLISPWHRWLDPARFQTHLDRVAALDAQVVGCAHGPALRGRQIASAFNLYQELPFHLPVEVPGQADLEAIVAAMTGPAVSLAA